MTDDRPFLKNCPVRERTADGVSVGRCWYHTKEGCCPRHGDVSKELEHYNETGKLSEDPRTLCKKRRRVPLQ